MATGNYFLNITLKSTKQFTTVIVIIIIPQYILS